MPPAKVTEPRLGRAREASPPPWWAPLAKAVAGAITANTESAASVSTASTVRPLLVIPNIVSPRFGFRFFWRGLAARRGRRFIARTREGHARATVYTRTRR